MFEMTTIVVDNDKTTTEANDTQRGLVYDSDRLPHVIEEEASTVLESLFKSPFLPCTKGLLNCNV